MHDDSREGEEAVDREAGEEVFSGAAGPPHPTRILELDRPTIQRPMVFVALAYIAGVALGRWILLPWWLLVLCAAALACASALTLFSSRKSRTDFRSSGALAIFALSLLGWAASNHAVRIDREAQTIARRFEQFAYTRVEGTLAELPVREPGQLKLVLANPKLASPPAGDGEVELPLKVLVRARGSEDADLPVIGSRIAAWGQLKPPRRATNPAAFDEARYLSGRGIGAELNVNSAANLEVLGGGANWKLALFRPIQMIREAMLQNIKKHLPPGEVSIATAILLGEQASLDDALYQKLSRTGIVHIISVSGLHTSMVLLVVLMLAQSFWLPPRACAIAGMIALVLYSALTGFLPPVVRASVMGIFLLVALALGRWATVWSALATSAFVTLVFDPRNLVRVDWQLSYLCMASLAILGRRCAELAAPEEDEGDSKRRAGSGAFGAVSRFAKGTVRAVAFVFAIQAGTLPVQVSLFGYVSLTAFIMNPIMIPLTFVIMLGSAVVALFGWIGPIGAGFGFLLHGVIVSFEWLVNFMAGVSWGVVEVPAMPGWLIAVYYIALLYGVHTMPGEAQRGGASPRQRRQLVLRLGLCLALFAWLPAFGETKQPGLFELYVMDVGQGDGLVLRFPDGKTGVVDGGSNEYGDQGRRTLAPFLKRLGVKRIDFLVATHADADHVGGLAYLIENFDVGLFIHGVDTSASEIFRRVMRDVADRRVTSETVFGGQKIEGLGGVQVEILNPWSGEDNNDASVAMLIGYGNVRMLLAGDIEGPAERTMLNHGEARDIDVLKIAHHGSKTSSTEAFLDAFTPEIALISVGRNNLYGHPAKATIDRLEERGVTIARTDQMGTLRVTTDGQRIKLEHFGK